MNATILILVIFGLLIIFTVVIPRIKMNKRAQRILKQMNSVDERIEYIRFNCFWPSAKKRKMDSKIKELRTEGWTYLKASSAPFRQTIKSLGGGLHLYFVKEKKN